MFLRYGRGSKAALLVLVLIIVGVVVFNYIALDSVRKVNITLDTY